MIKDEIIVPKGISTEEMRIFAKAAKDVFTFAWYVFVIHPIRGKTQFNLYEYQKRVLYYFLKNRFNIILKFRQAGITELISLYCLWLAMFHRNKNIQIISIKDRVAKKVLRRMKYMYRNLPWYLKVPIVNGRPGEIGTATEMEFSNGSTITSIPTTEDAGRSEAVSLLVIDEAAIVRWASQIWAAAFPTLSTGGSAIINSCVTGDTEIIGKDGNIRIDTIAPKEFGKQDISHLDLKVLSHTGKWQRVLGAVNKGELETWEIETSDGKRLKCTPAHKLLTPYGWRSVKHILKNDISVIKYNHGLDDLEDVPTTKPPKKEKIIQVKDYPNYWVSNLGRVYTKEKSGDLIEKESRPTGRTDSKGQSYYSISLWYSKQKKKFSIHKLVATHFIGEIPDGYLVDHINCNPEDNYVTNLQIITIRENTARAAKFSRGMKLGGKMGKGFPDLQKVALVRELYKDMGKGYGSYNEIIRYYEEKYDETLLRSYISRIVNNKRTDSVKIFKLKLLRKFIAPIYDISVENDQSYVTDSDFVNHNTPYGIGNFYHKTWVDGVAHGNDFFPIRLYWKMHPERDQQWYDTMSSALGPRRTAQEIDGDFLTSGNSVFDLLDIKAIEDSLTEIDILEERLNGNLVILHPPPKNKTIYIGADVASGRSRDYSAFTGLDRQGKEYFYYKGKIPVSQFADLLMKIGYQYNEAVLAPESNDIGLAVTTKIQDAGYPNLFYTVRFLKEKGEKKPKVERVPGWYTTTKNRSIMIEELEDDIRNDDIETYDKFFVQEAYTFIYDERNKPVALGKGNSSASDVDPLDDEENKYTDDSILAKSITNFIRKGKVTSTIITPR